MKISVSDFQFSPKSFTLFEVLIVVAILVVLTVIALPNFRFFGKESDLNNSTEEIINVLRLAQNKTLASEDASKYGVFFDDSTDPHQYTLFKTLPPLFDYVSRDINSDEIHQISKSVEIYSINLTGNQVVFTRISGEANQNGSVGIRLISEPTKTKIIYVENSGQVDLISPIIPSDADRVKDSRHVHFDLGWSIQNATNLKFYFPSISQTETVDMTNYFNVGKTEFDWEGKFTVNGVDQVFKIHTHSLDAFNTHLCIHRDRNQGKTNQEAIIYIVDNSIDKDIAHYLVDLNDTVDKGSYVNTMEKQ